MLSGRCSGSRRSIAANVGTNGHVPTTGPSNAEGTEHAENPFVHLLSALSAVSAFHPPGVRRELDYSVETLRSTVATTDRLNAERAEPAEKFFVHFFSAVSAFFAFHPPR